MENDSASDRPSADDARAALDGLSADGARLAERIVTPWWYHAALGLIVAVFGFSQALPGPEATVLVALAIVAIPALVLTYRQVYGVTLVEPAGPRSRRVLIVSIGIMVLVFAAGLGIRLAALAPAWGLIPAVTGFLMTVVVGRHYDDVLRDEIAAHGGPRA